MLNIVGMLGGVHQYFFGPLHLYLSPPPSMFPMKFSRIFVAICPIGGSGRGEKLHLKTTTIGSRGWGTTKDHNHITPENCTLVCRGAIKNRKDRGCGGVGGKHFLRLTPTEL